MLEKNSTIQFRGSPTDLEGLVPLAFQDVVSSGVPLLYLSQSKTQLQSEPLTMQAEKVGETATLLRVALPPIAPGKYEAISQIGKERYETLIEVEAEALLMASPTHLTLQAAAGSKVSAEITIINSGNIAVDIPARLKLGLLDLKAPERAFGVALHEKASNGYERINRFVEEMAAGHSGQLSLVVDQGAGTLGMGEMRRLQISLTVPQRLKAGRIYSGTLMLLNLAYYIEVLVTNGKASEGDDYEHDLNPPPG